MVMTFGDLKKSMEPHTVIETEEKKGEGKAVEFYAGGTKRYCALHLDSGIAISTPEDVKAVLGQAERYATISLMLQRPS